MSRPSVAIVVLDTLRYDVFKKYFEWVPGLFFDNAYSTAHWTVPAHASLLTGQYPSETGVHCKSRAFDYPDETLVEKLNEQGYTTRKWTANMQIHEWDGWDRGFDEVRSPEQLHPNSDEAVEWHKFNENVESGTVGKVARGVGHAVSAPEDTLASLEEGYRLFNRGPEEQGAGEVLARLRETSFSGDEFLLINLMECHAPYYPPKPFRSIDESIAFEITDPFTGEVGDPDRNRRAYDDAAAYLSAIYRDIFGELQDEFDLVVTLSDHGELLGEDDLWKHWYCIYPELVKIPLSIWGNDVPDVDGADAVREDVVSILDVPQTIADLTGVEFDSRGRNLLEDRQGTDRLVEYEGFLPWCEEKFEEAGIIEEYRRRNDPLNGLATREGYVYETHDGDLVSANGDLPQDADGRLADEVGDLSKREVEPDGRRLKENVKNRLEELGYA